MGLTRQLYDDERVAYRSLIYRRATYRAMIREHNAGTATLGERHLDTVASGITDLTHQARALLFNARARALGYQSSSPAHIHRVREMCASPVCRVW